LAAYEELRLTILDFTAVDARKAAEIRAALAAGGTPIGPYDVLIAGQALQRGLVVVTRNTREFSRVPGLNVENWEYEADQAPRERA
jgi:tRNA(fMet)-specific endonuclease VapC